MGYGDANPGNVSPLIFNHAEMRMAETRAVNRASRKAYGVALCSSKSFRRGRSPRNRFCNSVGPCNPPRRFRKEPIMRTKIQGLSQAPDRNALGYFTARLDPEVTRRAAVTAVRQAKRHNAFDPSRFIGLALDGTGAGRSRHQVCDLCRPYRNQKKEIQGYHHWLVLVSVVGTGLMLPLDVEPRR